VLRFSEEILLMALDEKTGRLHAMPERALEFAIAGALLGLTPTPPISSCMTPVPLATPCSTWH
jgi:hypothetical protein